MPFRQASDTIRRNFNITVSPDTIRRATETIGLEEFDKQKQELTGKEILECEEQPIPEQIYLQIDGSMVNTTTEGWKEYKSALFYDKNDTVKSGSKERLSIIKKKLTGALGQGYDDLIDRLRKLLIKAGAYGAKSIVLISDGSEWIEKVFQKLVPGGVMILDWYHACEHLWNCAKELFGQDSEQADNWVRFYKYLLLNGCENYMLERLLEKAEHTENQTPIRDLYSYFDTRRDRIRYSTFIKEGHPIGSGAVESAHKYAIQTRLKLAGARWNIENANGVAQLRNTYLSGGWDDLWQKAA